MADLRRLLLASFLVPALLVPGCRCVGSSARPRASEELQKKLEEDLARRDDPRPSATPSSNAFDIEARLETLRESFAAKSWESVRHDALALVTAPIDEITKLEVLQMLIDALRELGEKQRAEEFAAQFAKLYAELRDSKRMQKAKADRDRLLALVAKLKRRGNADHFAASDGEARTSFKLADKLRNAGPDEVLEAQLPDGGTVYYSRSPEALEGRVAAVARDASVQREPEFEYYYAIAEKSPPDRATSGTPPK